MAQCPATFSGRHHADCHWQTSSFLPGSRGLSSRSNRRRHNLSHFQSDRAAGRRSCRPCAAASTMAEEMVEETKTSERRQIQQLLNRCNSMLAFCANFPIRMRFFTSQDEIMVASRCITWWCTAFSTQINELYALAQSPFWTCREYKPGFTTLIESETFAKGLDETVVRAISAKKREPEWMLDFRLKAYRKWLTMAEPAWSDNRYALHASLISHVHFFHRVCHSTVVNQNLQSLILILRILEQFAAGTLRLTFRT